MGDLIDQVVIVDRLREVRALRSFSRYKMEAEVKVDLGRNADFLPAVEVFGEGIFLKFDEQVVRAWEARDGVNVRASTLRSRLAKSIYAQWLEAKPTARFIALHTFAHLLMRQLSFDAGYSASSLRERIYVAPHDSDMPMCGVLIYTSAGDSEGSLGGLARLGEAEKLTPTLVRMLTEGQWCSLDPVCSEAAAQGPDGLSLAACHACTLASETSCVSSNVLLDRRLLVDPEFGLMRDASAAVMAAFGDDE